MSETTADPSEQRSDETTEEWERRNREAAQATPERSDEMTKEWERRIREAAQAAPEAPPSEPETTSSDPYA